MSETTPKTTERLTVPLPALTLGMGHDLTDRIRRLDMPITKTRGSIATGSLAAMTLALTAPFSIAATVAQPPIAIPTTPLTAPAATVAEIAPVTIRTAEARAVPAAVPQTQKTRSPSTAAPDIYLVLSPDMDRAYEQALNRRRAAVTSGVEPNTYVTDWKGPMIGTISENHIKLRKRGGSVDLFEVTDANRNGIPLDRSTDLLRHFDPIISDCENRQRRQSEVSAFPVTLNTGSDAVLDIPYTAKCYSGADISREALVTWDNAAGIRDSQDMPQILREQKASGTAAAALFLEIKTHETKEARYAACVEGGMKLERDFPVTGEPVPSESQIEQRCEMWTR